MPADIDSVVDQFFIGIAPSASPTLTVFAGPIASGKTRARRVYRPGEFVHLDAGDVFNALGGPESPEFPGELEGAISEAGRRIAERAIAGHYNIVIETSGDQRAVLVPIIERMKQLNYRVEMIAITVDIEKSIAFNESRGPDNISSHFAQEYHLAWVAEAALRAGDRAKNQTADGTLQRAQQPDF